MKGLSCNLPWTKYQISPLTHEPATLYDHLASKEWIRFLICKRENFDEAPLYELCRLLRRLTNYTIDNPDELLSLPWIRDRYNDWCNRGEWFREVSCYVVVYRLLEVCQPNQSGLCTLVEGLACDRISFYERAQQLYNQRHHWWYHRRLFFSLVAKFSRCQTSSWVNRMHWNGKFDSKYPLYR